MVRLALFDIDGTLIRTGGAGERAFARVFATEFKVHDGTRGIAFAGRTDPSIVREFFGRYDIDPSAKNFQRFFDSYAFWLDHVPGESAGRVLAGVVNLLGSLSILRDAPLLGLLTGNIRLGAQIKLLRYGLWGHFRTGAFGDDHEDRNEIAAIARSRGQQLLSHPLQSHEVLVIGDTPFDIACGKAIGAKVLAVATGSFSLKQLQEHAPTWAVEGLEQICADELCE